MPRCIVLTSTSLRHQFLINRAVERFDVTGVWQESKRFDPTANAENETASEVITQHFAARNASEKEYFGDDHDLRIGERVLHRVIEAGGLNEEVDRMRKCNPDVVLVFGSGILRDPLLQAFEGNIINIHLGLSPYYRGSGTNFWPLVNGEPEYVGATIHYIDAGIDTGPMIAHVRPDIKTDDGPHDIGNRAIMRAVDALLHVAEMHVKDRLQTVVQEGEGKVYKNKDFNAQAVKTLYENFAHGMIAEYLENKEQRDAALHLIPLPC